MAVSELERELAGCIATCHETLDGLDVRRPGVRQPPFASAVLLAVAAFEVAGRSTDDDPRRELLLVIGARLGRDAAEIVRRQGADGALPRCAEACERGAWLCEDALRAAER